jgi:hypothetical protein
MPVARKISNYAARLITDHFSVTVLSVETTIDNHRRQLTIPARNVFRNDVLASDQLARDLLTVMQHRAAPIDGVL